MDIFLFKEKIRRNFKAIDDFLSKSEDDSELYKIFFSIRVIYAFYQEIKTYVSNREKTLYYIRCFFNLILRLASMPILNYHMTTKDKVIIIHANESRYVKPLSELVGIPYSYIVSKLSFNKRSFGNIFLYPKFIKCSYLILTDKTLNKTYAACSLIRLLTYIIIYSQIDLSGIEIIITQNDLYPELVAVIQKAKDSGIKTVKIEHTLINDTVKYHVLCDYYFYPSMFHKTMIDSSKFDTKVKYVKGGFLLWDSISKYENQPQEKPRIITFFTQHSNLCGEKDEIFYLDEILNLLPENYIIYIKVHPRDNPFRYNKFKNNPRCRIILFGEIDNYELISRCYMCVSVFSAASLEAKHICNKSFFINYKPDKLCNILDYSIFEDFFDIIKDKDTLFMVLTDKYLFKSREVFFRKFNMTYPNTKAHFLELLNKLNGK